MKLSLGLDLNCFTNRYVEPESWTELIADLGIKVVQFNFDLIDFTLPWRIQSKFIKKTNKLCKMRGIRIKCAFGGHNHHQNYLGHPDDEAAGFYETMYKRMVDLTSGLGAEGFGTCFAIMTVKSYKDKKRREEIIKRAVGSYFKIAKYMKKIGLKYLMFEVTSVPRETCSTFKETNRVLAMCKGMDVPMRLCLDVGHRNREFTNRPDSNPYEWIKKYGKIAPLIHIHQSNKKGSHHWPFTKKFNKAGDIFPGKVIDAVKASGAKQEILLALEVRHRAYYPDEYKLVQNMRESVNYWRKWIKH